MEQEVNIIKGDFELSFYGIKSLLKKFNLINKALLSKKDVIINIDFDQKTISHLNLSLLWRMLLSLKKIKKTNNVFIKYKGQNKDFFDQRHFFDRLVGKKSFISSTTIPINFETFNPYNENPEEVSKDSDINKIFEDVTSKFLDKNNPFHKEIKIHMLEVINNSFDHSRYKMEAGVICGLDSKNSILDFCIVDMGQGIKNSFIRNDALKAKYKDLPDHLVIDKATNFRVSCNPVGARNPEYKFSNGGIGLYFLKQFTSMHKDGQLVVLSEKGFMFKDTKKESKKNFAHVGWAGTAVYFRIYLDQQRSVEYNNIIGNYLKG